MLTVLMVYFQTIPDADSQMIKWNTASTGTMQGSETWVVKVERVDVWSNTLGQYSEWEAWTKYR